MRALWPLAGILCLGLLPAPAASLPQVEATPEFQGQVTLGGAPFPGAEVVLHRVSIETAGEIDTVRADTSGLFRFALPSVPREDQQGDVYFAAVRHQGILYFGRALSRAIQLDSIYPIETFDTLTAPLAGAPLPVAVRYVIAEPGPTGWQLTDLFEIANDDARTYVAAEGGLTWQHPLPPGARQATIGGGDISPDAAEVDGEVLRLSGPIPPGQREFVLRYEVSDVIGLEIPLATGTRSIEFLVREPAPLLDVEGIVGVESVEMQPGVTFRRYAGVAPTTGVLRIFAAEPPDELPVREVSVALALLLAGAGLYAVYRAGGAGGAQPAMVPTGDARTLVDETPADRRARLLLEVATIDQRLEDPDLDPSVRATLAARRVEVVTLLQSS